MAPRSVPEWIGEGPDAPIPTSVKRRIVIRQGGRCMDCTRAFSAKLHPQMDHRPPLSDPRGENRESKIEAVCPQCHLARTSSDAGERALAYRRTDQRLGIVRAPSRHPVPGSRNTKWEVYWNRERGDWEVRRREE